MLRPISGSDPRRSSILYRHKNSSERKEAAAEAAKQTPFPSLSAPSPPEEGWSLKLSLSTASVCRMSYQKWKYCTLGLGPLNCVSGNKPRVIPFLVNTAPVGSRGVVGCLVPDSDSWPPTMDLKNNKILKSHQSSDYILPADPGLARFVPHVWNP